jgi:hypothetical protein
MSDSTDNYDVTIMFMRFMKEMNNILAYYGGSDC